MKEPATREPSASPPPADPAAALDRIHRDVIACRRCPRLVAYTAEVARTKRRAYRDWDYWGRPVPGFGDPRARLLIVGLAPAAHGANRTGRMFTGDASGDWLYRALYRAGFASQPTSTHRDDGLRLQDAYITAACHCAPPDNRPSREELAACSLYLDRELEALTALRVIVCLGQIAFEAVLRRMRERGYGWPVEVEPGQGPAGGDGPEGDGPGGGSPPGWPATPSPAPSPRTNRRPGKPRFRHGGEYRWLPADPRAGGAAARDAGAPGATPPGNLPVLLASYHPSRQNTQTGVLTEAMFDAIFRRARQLVDGEAARGGPVSARSGGSARRRGA